MYSPDSAHKTPLPSCRFLIALLPAQNQLPPSFDYILETWSLQRGLRPYITSQSHRIEPLQWRTRRRSSRTRTNQTKFLSSRLLLPLASDGEELQLQVPLMIVLPAKNVRPVAIDGGHIVRSVLTWEKTAQATKRP